MTRIRVWNAVGAVLAPFALTTLQQVLRRTAGIEWLSSELLLVNSLIVGLIFFWFACPTKWDYVLALLYVPIMIVCLLYFSFYVPYL
jgi:membrane protein YdbS with pleckstrin-like domain